MQDLQLSWRRFWFADCFCAATLQFASAGLAESKGALRPLNDYVFGQLQQLHGACVTCPIQSAWTRTRHRPGLSQILEHSPPKKRTPCTSLDTIGTLSSTTKRNAAAKTETRECTARGFDGVEEGGCHEHAVDATLKKDKKQTIS